MNDTNYNHIPAYPTVEQHSGNQLWNTTEGMTLLDYFAAKAPLMPEYFTASVTAPRRPSLDVSGAEQEFLKANYFDDDNVWTCPLSDVPDELRMKVDDFDIKWKEYSEANSEFHSSIEFVKRAEWAYKYADAMIEERKKYIQ